MNVLPEHKRVLLLKLLTEGVSMRAAARIADVSRNTVNKLLIDAGRACVEYQDLALRNLPCRRVEVDEIWEFVYAKRKTFPVPRTRRASPATSGRGWRSARTRG